MASIIFLALAAMVFARILRLPRGTWRYILAGAAAVALATQLLPQGHPLRTDVAESARNLGWVGLGLVPVAIYAVFLARLQRRTGVAARQAVGGTADQPRHPVGLVQIAGDAQLAAETETRLAAETAAALGTAPRLRSLAWRAEDGSLAGHLRLAVLREVCEIHALRVDPAHRGAGIGTRLLAAAEEIAREEGARVMIARAGSWQAPGFLARAGYTTAWERAIGGGAAWFQMEKNLP